MSQENVELLRKAFAAYNEGFRTGDPSKFLSLTDPDVVWHTTTGVMEPVYRGREGVRRWMIEFYETWDELVVQPEEFMHADDDQVLTALRLRGRGKSSGVDVDMLLYEAITIRNGKLVGRRAYRNRAEALEAVGLSEQGAHADAS
jgi:ketosteroid isomerase-like protein